MVNLVHQSWYLLVAVSLSQSQMICVDLFSLGTEVGLTYVTVSVEKRWVLVLPGYKPFCYNRALILNHISWAASVHAEVFFFFF